MNVHVETYRGYKADEYPRSFMLNGEKLDIVDIEDRWYGPDYSYFKIFANNAKRYLLKQELSNKEWTVKII